MIFLPLSRKLNHVAKQHAEIESMLIVHGGNTNFLLKEAKDLAKNNTMSLRDAIQKTISKDKRKRIKIVGILS